MFSFDFWTFEVVGAEWVPPRIFLRVSQEWWDTDSLKADNQLDWRWSSFILLCGPSSSIKLPRKNPKESVIVCQFMHHFSDYYSSDHYSNSMIIYSCGALQWNLVKLYVTNCYNRSIHSTNLWLLLVTMEVPKQRDYSSDPTVITGIPGGIAGESACSLCHRSFVENSMWWVQTWTIFLKSLWAKQFWIQTPPWIELPMVNGALYMVTNNG